MADTQKELITLQKYPTDCTSASRKGEKKGRGDKRREITARANRKKIGNMSLLSWWPDFDTLNETQEDPQH